MIRAPAFESASTTPEGRALSERRVRAVHSLRTTSRMLARTNSSTAQEAPITTAGPSPNATAPSATASSIAQSPRRARLGSGFAASGARRARGRRQSSSGTRQNDGATICIPCSSSTPPIALAGTRPISFGAATSSASVASA